MNYFRLAAIAFGLALCWRPAAADILTYNFTATVTSQDNLGLSVGDLVTGSFSYNSAAPDFNLGNPSTGVYFQAQILQFSVGVISATTPFNVLVIENDDQGADRVRSGSIGGDPWDAGLLLFDFDQTVFSSDALPAPLPDLSEFETREFNAGLFNQTRTEFLGSFMSEITSLTLVSTVTVPEPSSLAMLGGSLLVGAMAARRRKRASSATESTAIAG